MKDVEIEQLWCLVHGWMGGEQRPCFLGLEEGEMKEEELKGGEEVDEVEGEDGDEEEEKGEDEEWRRRRRRKAPKSSR